MRVSGEAKPTPRPRPAAGEPGSVPDQATPSTSSTDAAPEHFGGKQHAATREQAAQRVAASIAASMQHGGGTHPGGRTGPWPTQHRPRPALLRRSPPWPARPASGAPACRQRDCFTAGHAPRAPLVGDRVCLSTPCFIATLTGTFKTTPGWPLPCPKSSIPSRIMHVHLFPVDATHGMH